MIVIGSMNPVLTFLGSGLLLAAAVVLFVYFVRINKSRKIAYDREMETYNRTMEEIRTQEIRRSEEIRRQERQRQLARMSPAAVPASASAGANDAVASSPRRILFMAPNGASYDIPMIDSITIGKNPRCDLIVKNGTVGDLHCKILYDSGAYMLQDLGFAAGTYFDGNKLPQNSVCEISSGVLRIGKVTFFVTIDEDREQG